jgi:hypothetical protein
LHRSSSPIAANSPSRGPLMLSCSRAIHHHPSPTITVHRHAVHQCQVTIAPSLSVHHHCNRSPSPLRSCCPSPSLTVHHHQRAVAPSITVKEPSRRPLPSRRTVHYRRGAVHRCQSVYCFQVAVAPSIAVHCCSVAIMPSIAVALRRPSPSSRHRAVLRRPSPLQSQFISVALVPSLAVHRRREAVAPSITVKSPSRRPSLSIAVHHRCDRSPSPSLSLIWLVVAFPLVMPTPSVHRFRSFRTACSTFF